MSGTKHGFFGKALPATLAVVALGAASVAQAATDLTVWHAYRGDEKAARIPELHREYAGGR